MTKFIKVSKVISDPCTVEHTVCPECLGERIETLNGIQWPCETCDGTGHVKYLEVVAIVTVSSNINRIWEV